VAGLFKSIVMAKQPKQVMLSSYSHGKLATTCIMATMAVTQKMNGQLRSDRAWTGQVASEASDAGLARRRNLQYLVLKASPTGLVHITTCRWSLTRSMKASQAALLPSSTSSCSLSQGLSWSSNTDCSSNEKRPAWHAASKKLLLVSG